MPIERLGFCALRDGCSSCAAASKGLIALSLRTTNATIAFSPLERFVSARLANPAHDLFASEFLQIIGGAPGIILAFGLVS